MISWKDFVVACKEFHSAFDEKLHMIHSNVLDGGDDTCSRVDEIEMKWNWNYTDDITDLYTLYGPGFLIFENKIIVQIKESKDMVDDIDDIYAEIEVDECVVVPDESKVNDNESISNLMIQMHIIYNNTFNVPSLWFTVCYEDGSPASWENLIQFNKTENES